MNLHVKIRKKYREGLLEKWTWKKNNWYGGHANCILCHSFRDEFTPYGGNMNCKGCPFNKYRKDKYTGCNRWIKNIDPTFQINKPTKKQFNKFIKKAKRYITFY